MTPGSAVLQPHVDALHISQRAPQYLEKHLTKSNRLAIPWLSNPGYSDEWATYEELLLSCLRTGDDKSACLCLEKLIARFGAENERVMGLRGIYQEAVAENTTELEKVLQEYDDALADNPTNTPIAKRRVALLHLLSRSADAIAALVQLLDSSPTDIEAWTKLSELYLSQGMVSQAIFCLEEVLLVAPNAWNIHARLGETLYLSSTISMAESDRLDTEKSLCEAVRRFCRSAELCNDYIRGYYGLKMSTDRLMDLLTKDERPPTRSGAKDANGDFNVPSLALLKRLNGFAVTKLDAFVKQTTRRKIDSGLDAEPEVIAVQELLSLSNQASQH